MSNLMKISDAVEALRDPLQALQAIEQLTHPSKAVDGIDLSLVDRQSLGCLLTTIHKSLASALEEALAAVDLAIESSKTSYSAGDTVAAPPPTTDPRPLLTPCRRRKE